MTSPRYVIYSVIIYSLFCSLGMLASLRAADLWWDTSGNGTWSTNTNWNTSADGSGSDPGSAPGASDTAYFNITTVNQAITANLTAALSIGGLVFNNTGNTSIRTNGAANRAITLGTSGITINSGVGNVTFGTATANQQVTFTLGGNQTWTNNSSNALSLIFQNTINTAGYGLTIGGSGNFSIASIISGAGSITKNGTGTLTLSAANTFTGGLTLNSGAIILPSSSSGALGTGASVLNLNGGSLYFNANTAIAYSRNTTIGGNASIMSDRPSDANLRNFTLGTLAIGANTLTVGGGNVSASGSTGIIFGATTLSGNATFNILNSTTGSPTTLTLGAITNQGYNVTLTGSGNLTMASTWNGTGGLTLGVSGGDAYNGTATLSAAKAFTGNVIINSGTISNTGSQYALGNGSVFLGDTTGSNSARLNFNNSGAVTAPSNLTVQAGSTGNVSLTSQTSANVITWSGNVTLNRSLTLAQTTNNTLTISGTISGAGGLNIGDSNITNNSIVSISNGNNTFTGETIVNSGTLQVSNANALQNSTLKMNGGNLVFNAPAGNFTFGGLAADASGAGYDLVLQNATSTAITLIVGNNNGTSSYAGVLSGAGNFTKSGTGTQTLSGNNTYTGTTSINEGTLEIGAAGRLGGGSYSAAISNNGSLVYSGTNDQILSGVMSGTGALTQNASSTLTLSGANTYTGTTTVNAGTLALGANQSLGAIAGAGNISISSYNLTANSSGNTIFSGVMSGTGAFTKNGTGSLTLSGNNTYSGGTTLNAGTLNMNSATALGTGTFTIAGGTIDNLSGAAVTLSNNNAQNWNGDFTFTGSRDLNLGTGAVAMGASRTVTVGSGNLTVGGAISGSGYGLTKNGTGTLILSGSNTYNGATTLNAGTLSVSGNIASSTTTVNSGATLTGTGTVGAITLNSGGLIGGGTGTSTVGLLTGSSLTIDAGSGYAFTIGNVNASVAGTDYDQISLSGALTLNNTPASPFSLYLYGTPTGWNDSGTYSWDIITASSLSGTFSESNFTTNFANFGIASGNRTGTWSFSNPSTGNIRLTYTGAFGVPVWSGGTGNWSSGFSPTLSNNGSMNFNGPGGTATNDIDAATINNISNITFASDAGAYILDATTNSAGGSGGGALSIGGSIVNNSVNTQTINLGLSFSSSRTVDAASGNITLGGIVSGAGGITKEGAYTLMLSAANTYTGSTTISSGILTLGSSDRIADTSNLDVAGGTLNLGGFNETLGSITGSGNITLGAGTLTTNSSSSTTFSGLISGTDGSLVKSGAGTFTLTGTNTYTGSTTINAGTLQIGGGGTSGSIASTSGVTNNATLAYNRSDAITASYAISGTGALIKNDAGTLILSGTNTYTGATTINTGTLQIGGGGTSGSIASTSGVTNNGTLVYNRSDALTAIYAISGTGALIKSGSGTLTLTGNNTYNGTTTINAGALEIASAGRLGGGSYSTHITNNGSFIYSGTNNQTLTGIISGTGGITMNGSGALTINASNAYSGGTIVNSGTLVLSNATALGTGVLTINGGTLSTNANLTLNNPQQVWNGNFTASNGGAAVNLNLGSGAVTVNGNRAITVNTGTLTVGGMINAAGLNLTKEGAGTLTLGNANSTVSSWTVNGGTLRGGINIGTFGYGATLNLVNGTLTAGPNSVVANDFSTNALNVLGNFTLNNNNSGNNNPTTWYQYKSLAIGSNTLNVTASGSTADGNISIRDGVTLSGNATINVTGTLNAMTFTSNGSVVESGGSYGLTKAGNGTLRLVGAGNYTGDTVISGGVLEIQNVAASSLSANTTLNGNTVTLGSTAGISIGQGVSGTGIRSGSYILAINAANSTITLSQTASAAGSNVSLTFAQTSGSLAGSTLDYDNQGGSINFGQSTAITLGGLKGNQSLSLTNNNTAALALTVGGNNQTTAYGGLLSGNGSMVKAGSGTLTLSGNNTYTGGTTLSTGTLVIGNAAAAGTGTITQSTGSSLLKIDTTGTIANNMSVYNVLASQSATLSGAITVNNADWEVDPGDTLTISGAVSGSGGVTKTGDGTLALTGNNTYTGATTVSAGTLQAAATGALANTSQVVLNEGGSFLVTADNAVNDSAAINLNGGRMAVSGNFNETVGLLTLSANSTLDFSGFSGVFSFSGVNSWAENTTLAIWNWSGTTQYGTQVNNYANPSRLVFDTSNAALTSNLANISFYSDSGNSFVGKGLIDSSFTGGGNLIIAIPETETYFYAVALLAGVVIQYLRRRAKRKPLLGQNPA